MHDMRKERYDLIGEDWYVLRFPLFVGIDMTGAAQGSVLASEVCSRLNEQRSQRRQRLCQALNEAQHHPHHPNTFPNEWLLLGITRTA